MAKSRGLLIEIKGLKTYFKMDKGVVKAVDGVSFDIFEGESIALVGESGSGKSVTSLSIMRLIPEPPGRIVGGEILFMEENLLKKTESEMRQIRGNRIAMVFQDPMSSLNPLFTVGDQIAETIVLHQRKSRRQALRIAAEMLEMVGIPEPQKRLKNYPYEMSGGMCQRVSIAIALSSRPKLFIADEPTSALDVTIQAQILDLILRMQAEFGMSILFITHDLGVAAEIADRIIVMYGGRILEQGGVNSVYSDPKHPYTLGLLNSIPRVDRETGNARGLWVIPGNIPDPLEIPKGCAFHPRCFFGIHDCGEVIPELEQVKDFHSVRCIRWKDLTRNAERPSGTILKQVEHTDKTQILLEVMNLHKSFPLRSNIFSQGRSNVKAVVDVSFRMNCGETLGIAGESGSGKTTLGRTILRLLEPNSGQIYFKGADIMHLSKDELRECRRKMQIIFQDPFGSLDPRMTIGEIIGEAYQIHRLAKRKERKQYVKDLLAKVGLHADYMRRYPHEFSGGQRQRIGIARALSMSPELIIADEPVSALDMSLRAQIINLLLTLKQEMNLTMILISHDLALVEYICDHVMIMYLGHIVEMATARELYRNPIHPYTEALFSAMPIPDPTNRRERILLKGDIPSPINPPSGCVFHTRCSIATDDCSHVAPPLEEVSPHHFKACIRR